MRERVQIAKLIRLAIEEDLGFGDITTDLAVPPGRQAAGVLRAKEDLVMCGGPLIPMIFEELGCPVEAALAAAEGQALAAGALIGRLTGEVRHLLSAERIVLNFLQHLCGVATRTRCLCEGAAGLTVLDTRKTTPGWRALEKYAVRVGGARNHRGHLGEMILLKDNHVDANGGDLAGVLREVRARRPFYMPIEVEVRSLAELESALAQGADIVMLDNMSDDQLAQSLRLVRERAPQVMVEVSGRVRGERLEQLQQLGVTCVSSSAMVTEAVWVDISMKLELQAEHG